MKILLDPVDFDALHLSFLEHGGVGDTGCFRHPVDEPAVPHCALGHGAWLEGHDDASTDEAMVTEFGKRLMAAGLTWERNDDAVLRYRREKGFTSDKIDFETYITLLNIDIKE